MLRALNRLMLVLILVSLGMMGVASLVTRLLSASNQLTLFLADAIDSFGTPGHYRLMMLDVDRALRQSISLPDYVSAAHWSPDGSRLLMRLIPNGAVDWQLTPFWEWDGHTLNNRTDLLNTMLDFDYLPSGDLIMVRQTDATNQLDRLTPDGKQYPVVELPGAFQIDVSDNGSWLLANGVDAEGKAFTELLNLMTLEHCFITDERLVLSDGQWTWAGDDLIYIRDGNQIQHQTRDGKEQTLWRLPQIIHDETIGTLALSPDRQSLAFTADYNKLSGDSQHNLFVLDLKQANNGNSLRGLRQIPTQQVQPYGLSWSSGNKLSYLVPDLQTTQTWNYKIEDQIVLRLDLWMASPLWRP